MEIDLSQKKTNKYKQTTKKGENATTAAYMNF